MKFQADDITKGKVVPYDQNLAISEGVFRGYQWINKFNNSDRKARLLIKIWRGNRD